MKQSSAVRAVTFSLAAALVAVGFAVTGWHKVSEYEKAASALYERSYGQLASDLSELNSSLTKLSVSGGTGTLVPLCTSVYSSACSAGRTLEALPLSAEQSGGLCQFVNRAGDYALNLVRKSAEGVPLTEEERSALRSLCAMAQTVCDVVGDGCSLCGEKNFFVPQNGALSGLADELSGMQESMPETPVLLYDGPFSDHILTSVPACVQNEAEISAEEAAARLAAALGVKATAVTRDGEGAGKLPVWCLSCRGKNGEVSAELAKNGGGLALLFCEEDGGNDAISEKDALVRASSALAALGFGECEPTYSYREGGVLYVNFAAVQNGVLCYPDLVQIGISLASGNLSYVQATGYLANHRDRTGLTASVSASQARSALWDGFATDECRLCLIPTDGEGERLAWEFHALRDGQEYLVYIDATTGKELRILRLLYSDQGTLAQ